MIESLIATTGPVGLFITVVLLFTAMLGWMVNG